MKKQSLFYALAFAGFTLLQACSDVGMPRESLESDKLSSVQIMDENVVEGDVAHQEEANMKITKLHKWFGQTKNRSGGTVPDYPAYYGEAFITLEAKLIVYIAGDIEKNKQAVASVIGESGVEFRPAENSYAALNERMKAISAYVNNNRNGENSAAKDVVGIDLPAGNRNHDQPTRCSQWSQSGTIISTNRETWNSAGVHFTNLTETTYASTNGDSGGVIYSYISSTGTRRTVGVHKGRLNNGYGNPICSKASEILSAFSLTRH